MSLRAWVAATEMAAGAWASGAQAGYIIKLRDDVGSLSQFQPYAASAWRSQSGSPDLEQTLDGWAAGLENFASGMASQGGQHGSASGGYGFDVTFKSMPAGVHDMTINAAVDGAIVATERDTTTVVASGVPEPATWAMMLIGFAGLGFAGYRKRKGQPSMVR